MAPPKKRIDRICIFCGKSFWTHPSELNRGEHRGNYCSIDCYRKYNVKENHPRWRGGDLKKICEICGVEYSVERPRENISRFCSSTCQSKWLSSVYRGENHARWNGGSPLMMQIYGSTNYRNWRNNIFGRDKFTCRCGNVGNKLNAHHDESFAYTVQIRYGCKTFEEAMNCKELWDINITTGQTLCEKCHKEYHVVHGKFFIKTHLHGNNFTLKAFS